MTSRSKGTARGVTRSTSCRRRATSTMTWRHITCRIIETRNFLTPGTTQLEIRVVRPKGALLPVTTTGYRAEYVSALAISNAGGAHLFITQWLNKEAASKTYIKAESAWRQPSLF